MIALLVSFFTSVQASFLDQYLVKGGVWTLPQRGSVGGPLGHVDINGSNLSDGSFRFAIPVQWSDLIEPSLAPLVLTYDNRNPQSEWGLGVQALQAVTRFRDSGQTNYKDDDFLSPWGKLSAGQDGAYYVSGMSYPVRGERHSSQWTFSLEDGSTWHFGLDQDSQVGGGGKTLSWYLSKACLPNGMCAHFDYRKVEDFPVLKSVTYLLPNSSPLYRLDVDYEAVPQPIVIYQGGFKRVLRIRPKSLHWMHFEGKKFLQAYQYNLFYEGLQYSSGFFLKSFQRSQGDKSEPAMEFSYKTQFEPYSLPPLDFTSIQENEKNLIWGGGTTLVDEDGSGEIGFELANLGYRRLSYQAGIFALSSRLNLDPRCGYQDRRNHPRYLSRLRGHRDALTSFQPIYDDKHNKTKIRLCSLEGAWLEEIDINGRWDFEKGTSLVDLNADGRPDLVKLHENKLLIKRNKSREQVEFANDSEAISLNAPRGWSQYHFVDMNGDGILDLVLQYREGLKVFWGKGDLKFDVDHPNDIKFETDCGRAISLPDDSLLVLVDLNGDGVADALLSQGSRVLMLLNDGTRFRQVHSEKLKDLLDISVIDKMTPPLLSHDPDDGTLQLLFRDKKNHLVHRLGIQPLGVRFLKKIKDNRGNELRLTYKSGKSTAGVFLKPVVLAKTELHSVGHQVQHTELSYDDPIAKTNGPGLLGYRQIQEQQGPNQKQYRFLFWGEDHVILESLQETGKHLSFLKKSIFSGSLYKGLPYMQRVQEIVSCNGEKKLEYNTSFGKYLHPFCSLETSLLKGTGILKRTRTVVSPSALPSHLGCWAASESISGKHLNGGLDFELKLQFQRDPFGRLTRLVSGEAPRRIIQEVSYDTLGVLRKISNHGGLSEILFSYDDQLRLTKLARSDHFEVGAAEFDDLGRMVQHNKVDPGGLIASSWAYDALGRVTTHEVSTNLTPNLKKEWSYEEPSLSEGRLGKIREKISGEATNARELLSVFSGRGHEVASFHKHQGSWVTQKRFFNDDKVGKCESLGSCRLDESQVTCIEGLKQGPVLSSASASFQELDGTSAVRVPGCGNLDTTFCVDCDGHHLLKKSHSPLGTSEETMDGALVPLRRKNADGVCVSLERDALDRVRLARLPGGHGVSYDYDSFGDLTCIKSELYGELKQCFDVCTGLLRTETLTGSIDGPTRVV